MKDCAMRAWKGIGSLVTVAFLLGGVATGDHPPAGKGRPAKLLKGLGELHHPVSTSSKEAQQFFDQGLKLVYAFNHDEAVRSFRRAAELDPKLAMAHWGVALALGSNYNLEAQEEQLKGALKALRKAQALARGAPGHERAYVEALAKRYSADPKADKKKLALAYKLAMGKLAERYPDDLDAATLYAESAMNLRPWKLLGLDGTPAEGTEEVLAVLESVLRRDPNHTGANHYYIHAVEASPHPEKALPSAERLKTLAPAAGHLVHMPSHIYLRTGDYEQAARQNELAIRADEATLKEGGDRGVYAMMYFNHNIHFLAVARAFQGRFADARKAADRLADNVRPHVKDMPMLEGFLPTPTLVLVCFRRWDDVLKLPAPGGKLHATKAVWRFARGMALAGQGKPEEAEKELAGFRAARKAIPEDAMLGDHNKAHHVLGIAERVLRAKVAEAKGDRKAAVGLLKEAVKEEDALNYIEPPDWYLPVRNYLGGVLLRGGDPAGAEKVFRAELNRRPRSGRALFGLWESLKAQKKAYAAGMVERQWKAAWERADTRLTTDDL
jgi:tetratricopeptide (TPR) repeat protein